MDAIQHKVISLIEALSARFPSMSFTYGYDAVAQQHLVNVDPTDMYGSDEYKLAEADIYDAWDAAFPDEELAFVSNDPYHKVEHPIFVIAGEVALDAELTAINDEPLLVDGDGTPSPSLPANELFGLLALAVLFVVFGKKAVVHTIPVYESVEAAAGEYNYAMAA